MADISITAANVLPISGPNESGIAGETITAGQALYKATTGKWMKADADGTAGTRKPTAIALNGASLNQPLQVQTGGVVAIGAILTAGARYYASGTAGGIAPEADLATGDQVVLIGIAKTTANLQLSFLDPDVTL